MAHRIKVKLGDAEFEAEGAEEKVQAQYDQFLAALERQGPPAAPQKKPAKTSIDALDDAYLARLFEQRQDGIVALKHLPKGDNREADALLLILLGYRRLKNEETVLATQLLRAAEVSGLSIYRPAHALAQYDNLVMRGGYKKGSTYSLNNQGLVKAEEIAARIFE